MTQRGRERGASFLEAAPVATTFSFQQQRNRAPGGRQCLLPAAVARPSGVPRLPAATALSLGCGVGSISAEDLRASSSFVPVLQAWFFNLHWDSVSYYNIFPEFFFCLNGPNYLFLPSMALPAQCPDYLRGWEGVHGRVWSSASANTCRGAACEEESPKCCRLA